MMVVPPYILKRDMPGRYFHPHSQGLQRLRAMTVLPPLTPQGFMT